MKWKKYWNQYPTQFAETEFFNQIGNTISGKPISADQFNASISDIKNGLKISSSDIVLDMCCGNGIRTFEISKVCNSIIGIDISDPLINIAKKYYSRENILYHCLSILDKRITKIEKTLFTKVFMYGGLQYFTKANFLQILANIKIISKFDAEIFIGSVPERSKYKDFYEADPRRKIYLQESKKNNFGTWWKKEELAQICYDSGYIMEFIPQNKILDTAYYRFDFHLNRKQESS